jgi:Alw26I/Eco31I/Esp3I family type II restriction m6 adenine DNA methyltransferase
MHRLSGNQDTLDQVLSKCYVADNDPYAISHIQEILPVYLRTKFGFPGSLPAENIFLGNSLLDGNSIRNLRIHFGEPVGFDYIMTNPPYKQMKSDRRLQGRTLSSEQSQFTLSSGTPNLYKYFVEAIAKSWLSDSGTMVLLVPRSLLTDYNSEKLRGFILENYALGSILNMDEGNSHFRGVGQAFSGFAATRGNPTDDISFADLGQGEEKLRITSSTSLKALHLASGGNSLVQLGEDDQRFLVHMNSFEKVGNASGILNLRGEFDISLDKNLFSTSNESIKLIRGSNIGRYSLSNSDDLVKNEIRNRPKGKWIDGSRLACQQISNRNQALRLKFALVPAESVLANSCNFIALDPNVFGDEREEMNYYLLGVLNSSTLNRYFSLLSPNNHISNKEIDRLPLPVANQNAVFQISDMARAITMNYSDQVSREIDILVDELFGLR